MKGNIYLARIGKDRIVPVLCLGHDVESKLMITAQIRKANEEDIFNTKDRKTMNQYNRGKKEKDQIKIREKHEVNTVFIGKPEGVKTESVVMISKIHKIAPDQIVKKISNVPHKIVDSCFDLQMKVERINKLKKELSILKRKIQLSKINNEKYSDLEKRFEEIRKEIGYPEYKKKESKPYLNYREVPSQGYLKIFKGGRCK